MRNLQLRLSLRGFHIATNPFYLVIFERYTSFLTEAICFSPCLYKITDNVESKKVQVLNDYFRVTVWVVDLLKQEHLELCLDIFIGIWQCYGCMVCFWLIWRREKLGAFNKHDFELLAPVLDGFSLMTYDYSSQGRYWTIAELSITYNVVVQFYPWLKFDFLLFETQYQILPYPNTKENKI